MTPKPEPQLPFVECVMRRKVAQICENIGYTAITQDSCNVLVDVFQKTIFQLSRHCKEAAIRNRRNESTLTDLSQALGFLNLSIPELDDHIKRVKLPFPERIEKPELQPTSSQLRTMLEDDEIEEEKKDDEALSENGNEEEENACKPTLKDSYLEILSQFPNSVEVQATSKAKKPKKVDPPFEPPITNPTLKIPILEIKTEPLAQRDPTEPDFGHSIPRVSIIKQPKGKKKKKHNQFSIVTETVDSPDVKRKKEKIVKKKVPKPVKKRVVPKVAKTKKVVKPLDPSIAEPPSFLPILDVEVEPQVPDVRSTPTPTIIPQPEPEKITPIPSPKIATVKQEKNKGKKKKKHNQFAILTETVTASEDKEWFCPTCLRGDEGDLMVQCDTCQEWYHLGCTNLKKPPEDDENWECSACIAKQANKKEKHPSTSSARSTPSLLNIIPSSSSSIKLEPQAPTSSGLDAAAASIAAAAAAAAAAKAAAIAAAEAAGCRVEDLCPECNLPDDGTMMIQCDDPFCAKWFHGKCVGLLDEPKEDESWFCKACVEKQQSAFKRRRGQRK